MVDSLTESFSALTALNDAEKMNAERYQNALLNINTSFENLDQVLTEQYRTAEKELTGSVLQKLYALLQDHNTDIAVHTKAVSKNIQQFCALIQKPNANTKSYPLLAPRLGSQNARLLSALYSFLSLYERATGESYLTGEDPYVVKNIYNAGQIWITRLDHFMTVDQTRNMVAYIKRANASKQKLEQICGILFSLFNEQIRINKQRLIHLIEHKPAEVLQKQLYMQDGREVWFVPLETDEQKVLCVQTDAENKWQIVTDEWFPRGTLIECEDNKIVSPSALSNKPVPKLYKINVRDSLALCSEDVVWRPPSLIHTITLSLAKTQKLQEFLAIKGE